MGAILGRSRDLVIGNATWNLTGSTDLIVDSWGLGFTTSPEFTLSVTWPDGPDASPSYLYDGGIRVTQKGGGSYPDLSGSEFYRCSEFGHSNETPLGAAGGLVLDSIQGDVKYSVGFEQYIDGVWTNNMPNDGVIQVPTGHTLSESFSTYSKRNDSAVAYAKAYTSTYFKEFLYDFGYTEKSPKEYVTSYIWTPKWEDRGTVLRLVVRYPTMKTFPEPDTVVTWNYDLTLILCQFAQIYSGTPIEGDDTVSILSVDWNNIKSTAIVFKGADTIQLRRYFDLDQTAFNADTGLTGESPAIKCLPDSTHLVVCSSGGNVTANVLDDYGSVLETMASPGVGELNSQAVIDPTGVIWVAACSVSTGTGNFYVYRSTDQGLHWSSVGSGTGTGSIYQAVGSAAIEAQAPQLVGDISELQLWYHGSGTIHGIKSIDSGITWSAI